MATYGKTFVSVGRPFLRGGGRKDYALSFSGLGGLAILKYPGIRGFSSSAFGCVASLFFDRLVSNEYCFCQIYIGARVVPNTHATATLLLHTQQGDTQAIDQLYRHFQDRVLTAVRYRLGRKLRQKVESADIVQNLLRCWRYERAGLHDK